MRRTLKTSLALACAAALMTAAGCGSKEAERRGRDYTLRAIVVHVPEADSPTRELHLYHEAIDDWAGRGGEVEGMDPMSMPFLVAEGVSLEGLQPNDKVEARLHVDWEADRPVEVTQIRELPADTRLVFREAKPPRNP